MENASFTFSKCGVVGVARWCYKALGVPFSRCFLNAVSLVFIDDSVGDLSAAFRAGGNSFR